MSGKRKSGKTAKSRPLPHGRARSSGRETSPRGGRRTGGGIPPAGPMRWYPLLVVLAVLALGLYQAGALRWSCDDIFITLRYVDNLFSGHGLVYNPGEHVEGYTHFLWLVLLLIPNWLGLDPVGASQFLGLLSFAGVLVIFSSISYKLNRRSMAFFLPMTPLVLAVHRDFAIWATSGLETMFFTFLLSAAFYLYFIAGVERRKRIVATGLLLILATMTRPDGALIYVLANTFLLAGGLLWRRRPKEVAIELGLFNLAFVVLYVPYFIWKLSYYGYVFPNSYYAKSGNLSFFSRGFFYLWLYFRAYVTSWLFLLAVPALVVSWGRTSGGAARRLRSLVSDPRLSGVTFAFVGALAYGILFVARVGGDFMYARFVIPMVPFFMFLTESGLAFFLEKRKRFCIAAFIIIAAVVGVGERAVRDGLMLEHKDGQITPVTHKGIIDERHYYKYASTFDLEKKFGLIAAEYFKGLDVTVVLKGQAALGYYGKFKTCIECYGLTDEYIAHMPLKSRSRVGHEKEAPYDYLIERGTDFQFGRKQYKRQVYRIVKFNMGVVTVEAELLTYDKELITALASRFGKRMEYVDFEKMLDWYIQNRMPDLSHDQLKSDYEEYKEFYFMHNDDGGRESIFLDALERLAPAGTD